MLLIVNIYIHFYCIKSCLATVKKGIFLNPHGQTLPFALCALALREKDSQSAGKSGYRLLISIFLKILPSHRL